jgi:hypothetical protein
LSISCVIGADTLLGGADLLFVKWPTPRERLSAGLAQD